MIEGVLMSAAVFGLILFLTVVGIVRKNMEAQEPGTRAIVWAIVWATFYMSAVVGAAVWFLVYGVG